MCKYTQPLIFQVFQEHNLFLKVIEKTKWYERLIKITMRAFASNLARRKQPVTRVLYVTNKSLMLIHSSSWQRLKIYITSSKIYIEENYGKQYNAPIYRKQGIQMWFHLTQNVVIGDMNGIKRSDLSEFLSSILCKGHLGPDSSTGWRLSVESWIHSLWLCGANSSCRTTSTFCHSSHLSARPSPSSILTTSDILGRSNGEPWVHSSATWISDSTSASM